MNVPIHLLMGARRLIYFLLASMPVTFTASVGIGTRMNPLDWTTPEFGPEMCQSIAAYIPLLRETLERAPARSKPDPIACEAMANKWIAAKLPELSPGNMPVSGLEGPFYDIQRVRQNLCNNLIRLAHEDVKAGDVKSAAHRTALVLRVCEVAKYSSVNSISMATESQRESFKLVSQIQDKVDGATRKGLESAVRQVSIDPNRTVEAAKHLLAATKTLYSTSKSLKRYASNDMVPIGLSKRPSLADTSSMTTEELTVAGLAESAVSMCRNLGDFKATLLKSLVL
ncbi:MAG: hypothetical protein JSS65_00815 [Armatimonadetes bacterium]|nr:hypothetical protein [Armatimonadota bacterium]